MHEPEQKVGLPVPVVAAALPADPRTPAQKLYEAWLGGRSQETRRAYAGGLLPKDNP